MPTVGAARPSRCPLCACASAPLGVAVVVVGHGLRARTVLGPPVLGAAPVRASVMQRRFRCRACSAVIIVRPRGIADRVRYTATAIALALYRWSHDGCAGHVVAQQVSPQPPSLYTRQHGWRQLRRWSYAAKQIWGGLRLNQTVAALAMAAAVIAQLAAHCQNGATRTLDQVWDGAHHA